MKMRICILSLLSWIFVTFSFGSCYPTLNFMSSWGHYLNHTSISETMDPEKLIISSPTLHFNSRGLHCFLSWPSQLQPRWQRVSWHYSSPLLIGQNVNLPLMEALPYSFFSVFESHPYIVQSGSALKSEALNIETQGIFGFVLYK